MAVGDRQRRVRAARRRLEGRKPPLGSGERFSQLKKKLGSQGARNPGALAAYIGRKKYGAKKMAKMSAAGRKKG